MNKHTLNSRQFMYMWALLRDPLYTGTTIEKGKSKKLLTFGEEGTVMTLSKIDPIPLEELKELEEKGFIIDLNSGSKYYFDSFVLTPLFPEEFFIAREDFEELWECYPITINVNGSIVPARSGDYDTLRQKYIDIIGKDKDLHQNILTVTEQAKERGLINLGLEKYILGRHWITYYSMMEESKGYEGKVI